jgi:hypothetical protein
MTRSAKADRPATPRSIAGTDDCFPRLDVWAFPEPVKTDAALYGPNGAAVAALLTAALDLDMDGLWRIASAADFDYADREQRRADERRIRDLITVAAQATNRVEEVRLAFAAGERAAFYAAGPGLGTLDFWGNQAEASATAPVGYAAAAFVVADALASDDLDLALRAWRAGHEPRP